MTSFERKAAAFAAPAAEGLRAGLHAPAEGVRVGHPLPTEGVRVGHPLPAEGVRPVPHARFIAREALGGFTAWQPGHLTGGPAPQGHVQRAAEAPKIDLEAQLAAQLATQSRAARQAGYQDGYRDGLVALEGFKQSFAMQASARIATLVAALHTELDAVRQDIARTIAVTATQLARQIVRSELAAQPALVAAVAHEALDTLLLSARHITLRVHPDDHALVAHGAGEALAARGARLLADASVARGGCRVESDIGVIDASVEARWRRAVAALGCEAAWDPDAATEATP